MESDFGNSSPARRGDCFHVSWQMELAKPFRPEHGMFVPAEASYSLKCHCSARVHKSRVYSVRIGKSTVTLLLQIYAMLRQSIERFAGLWALCTVLYL